MAKRPSAAKTVTSSAERLRLALARKGARVFAVEANPAMAKAAAGNCALNGASGVTIVNKAASDRPGEVTFASVGVHYVGSSKIIPDASAAEKLKFLDEMNGLSTIDLGAKDGLLTVGDLVVQTVEATTLDLICKKHALRDVAFVKIDIEGAELIALRGAKKLLDGGFGRPPIVALEFSRIVPVIGGTPEDIFAEFADRGWTVHIQKNGKSEGGPLVRLNAASEAPDHDNVICLPPGRDAP